MKSEEISWFSGLFSMGAMQRRIAELEAELQVRKDIMDITSIVSEANKKGDIISLNEKFVAVSKYSRDELMGAPHSTTRHPDITIETPEGVEQVTAVELDDAQYTEAWRRFDADSPIFAKYQESAGSRRLPIFRLQRR